MQHHQTRFESNAKGNSLGREKKKKKDTTTNKKITNEKAQW